MGLLQLEKMPSTLEQPVNEHCCEGIQVREQKYKARNNTCRSPETYDMHLAHTYN